MQLQVKHFSQPGVYACVAGAVKIILNDKNKRISFKNIVPGVGTTKDGTDLIHAAIFCAKIGTRPQFYWSSFDRMAEIHGRLTSKEAADLAKSKKNEGWPWSKLAELVEAGGTWHPRRRNSRLIRSVLKKGIPVGLDVNANRRPFGPANTDKDLRHVIVAVGFTDKYLLYLDPGDKAAIKRISWKRFYKLSREHDGEALFLL